MATKLFLKKGSELDPYSDIKDEDQLYLMEVQPDDSVLSKRGLLSSVYAYILGKLSTYLGDSATKNVGTAVGTIAAGDHGHAQLHARQHAIDSANDHTGFGNSITKDVGTGAEDVAAGDHSHELEDITDAGGAAALNVGTGAEDVAAGDHGHTDLHQHANKATLDAITEEAELPLWKGAPWPDSSVGLQIYTFSVDLTAPAGEEIVNAPYDWGITWDSVNEKLVVNHDIMDGVPASVSFMAIALFGDYNYMYSTSVDSDLRVSVLKADPETFEIYGTGLALLGDIFKVYVTIA